MVMRATPIISMAMMVRAGVSLRFKMSSCIGFFDALNWVLVGIRVFGLFPDFSCCRFFHGFPDDPCLLDVRRLETGVVMVRPATCFLVAAFILHGMPVFLPRSRVVGRFAWLLR